MELYLRRVRKQLGITQISLSKAIGVSNALIHYWEGGKRRPPIEKVKRLSELLGVAPSELIRPVVS